MECPLLFHCHLIRRLLNSTLGLYHHLSDFPTIFFLQSNSLPFHLFMCHISAASPKVSHRSSHGLIISFSFISLLLLFYPLSLISPVYTFLPFFSCITEREADNNISCRQCFHVAHRVIKRGSRFNSIVPGPHFRNHFLLSATSRTELKQSQGYF